MCAFVPSVEMDFQFHTGILVFSRVICLFIKCIRILLSKFRKIFFRMFLNLLAQLEPFLI